MGPHFFQTFSISKACHPRSRDPEIPSTQRAWSLLGENCGIDVGTWAASHADFIFFRLPWVKVDELITDQRNVLKVLITLLLSHLLGCNRNKWTVFFGFQSPAACIAAWRVRMDDRKCVLFKRGVNSVSYDEL